jgi:uncharacterized protein YoaH (UPF0181 family)
LTINFIDLKAQQQAIYPQIQERIPKVMAQPMSEGHAVRIFSIPMPPCLHKSDQEQIVETICRTSGL